MNGETNIGEYAQCEQEELARHGHIPCQGYLCKSRGGIESGSSTMDGCVGVHLSLRGSDVPSAGG
jgi:hypothetical protein